MAPQLPCEICGEEAAIQMLTNLVDGTTMTLGANCLPVFYGQSALIAIQAGDHKGPATKCQACRRFHERMTTPVAPLEIPGPPEEQPEPELPAAADQADG